MAPADHGPQSDIRPQICYDDDVQTIVCLLCGRQNAAHRNACLYCGESLPGGGLVPPADPNGDLAPELDKLVRDALAGAGTARLRDALVEAQTRRNAPATKPLPADVVAPQVGTLSDALARLLSAANQAIACQSGRDLPGLHEALRQATDAITLATTLTPPETSPPAEATPSAAGTIRLPPAFHALSRHPFALLVEGRGEAERIAGIAAAMGTDGATARQIALSRHARLVSRGEDPVRLSQIADEIERRTGLSAAVVHRDELRAAPDPLLMLGLEGERTRFTTVAVWLAPETTVVEGRMDMPELRLGVPGEVTVRRFRRGRDLGALARRGTTGGVRDLGEQRFSVLDLHGPGVALRLIEGVTDLRGLPGVEGQSTMRCWASMLEHASERWPMLVMEGARVCPAESSPPVSADADHEGPITTTGWPAWEEHTRICRLLAEQGWR